MNSLGCTLISETGERHHFTSFRKASEFLNRSRGYISQCIQHRVPLTHNDTHEHYDIECDEMDKTTIAHVRKRSQPCCNCKKFAGGCSWSRRFEPVKGWTAVPTVINHGGNFDGSYMILHCPEFERGVISTAEKKYYWLKLKEDFFTSKRIKKLRKMAGGDTYTIIYLKMQLLSLKTDGILHYTGLEDNFASELALDLDESPEDVGVVLMYLASCGLIETSDNVNFLLPYVVTNTGSETDAAKRMREMRNRNNVTPMLQQCDTEKEREKELKTKNKNIYEEFADGDSDLLNALKEFDSYRKLRKKPLTDNAKGRLISKLKKFPKEHWIKILFQSIDRGWTDIYELKTDFVNQKKVTPGMGTVEERQAKHGFTPTQF